MKLKPLKAIHELKISSLASGLLPELLAAGLDIEDGWALACNTAKVHLAQGGKGSPRQIWQAFSLKEIAALCRQLEEPWEEGEHEY